MQFSGALLLGRGVTSTIKSGIVDPDAFEDSPGSWAGTSHREYSFPSVDGTRVHVNSCGAVLRTPC